ncbi:MAG: peptidyl-prolyl cis-trans isomerase [Candidatus Fermentibacter sp.]|nr:peptidyl-prolyl cis-trans isomerase [Candidatus Fermentibacter sp.]
MRYVLIPTVMFLLSCGREEAPAAVSAGGRVLSYDDAAAILENIERDSVSVTAFAENAVDRLLILEDACARGLDEDPEIASAVHDAARTRLQYIYLQYKLGSVEVPEDSIRSFYDRMGEELVFTAIQADDSLTADSLRALVAAGADARALAASSTTLMQDRPTRGRCGPTDRTRLVGVDRDLLAGLAPGDISRIASTPSGFRFLRLDSVLAVEPPPFEEAEGRIRDFIWAHMSEEYRNILEDSLVQARGLRVDSSAAGLVASHALDPVGHFSPYTESEARMTAISWDGGERSVISLACNIRDLPENLPRTAGDTAWVTDYCHLLGLYEIMAARAVELGLDEHPVVGPDIRDAQEQVLLDAWFETVAGPRILITDQDMQDAWNDNRDMLLMPEERVFRLVYATPGAQASALSTLLAAGGDPLADPGAFTVPAALMEDAGSALTRPLEMSDLPAEVGPGAFSLAPGQVLSCSVGTGGLVFVRLEEVIPEREATLEESRDALVPMLYSARREEVLAGLVDSLRSAYAWNIDWEFFARFWRDGAVATDHPGVE